MKKQMCLLAALILTLTLSACGNSAETPNPAPADSPESTVAENTPDAQPADASPIGGPDQTDILDLTALSGTMVYAEVYNLMAAPENYLGRTVKMSGQFSFYAATDAGPYYYACVIADATACCQQGIEFVLADERLRYPEDYPELGATITVTGVFQTYEEDGLLYCHLVDARFD